MMACVCVLSVCVLVCVAVWLQGCPYVRACEWECALVEMAPGLSTIMPFIYAASSAPSTAASPVDIAVAALARIPFRPPRAFPNGAQLVLQSRSCCALSVLDDACAPHKYVTTKTMHLQQILSQM